MTPRYLAISALAGSGKTYRLTTRFIDLLSRGVAPETILAITFTRKAAGEIFDRVVSRLAAAILRQEGANELRDALRSFKHEPHFDWKPGEPEQWLRKVLVATPRLHIGTIDSLFASIVRAYGLELGLPPRQEILEGGTLEAAREEALRAALDAARKDAQARQGFLEAFKHATAGEDKNVRRVILDLVERAHQLFLQCPDEEAWGNPSRMWPGPTWWYAARGVTLQTLESRVEKFKARHLAGGADARYVKAWTSFLEELVKGDPVKALGSKLAECLADQRDHLEKGRAEITYFKKAFVLAGEDAADALLFLAFLVNREITRALSETKGCYRLMRAYEAAYQTAVRSLGRLSFEDIRFVLARAGETGVKLDIDYRLDGRFDHWMLDEFQDTSVRQWSVIGNLADEILQSDTGGRTFLYVGDVKQAIYGWRGGDATLFEVVQRRYRHLFGDKPDVLDVSWRSSPVVLRTVNQVFGPGLSGPLADYKTVVNRWNRHWQEHRVAEKNRNLPGRVELYALQKPNREAPSAYSPTVELTCRLVEKLQSQKVPSIAVLVRLNSFGDEVADALRERKIEVRRETHPQLLDNGVISALLSMLRWADHPGDDFAWQHVRMTGLFDVLRTWAGAKGGAPLRGQIAAKLRKEAAVKGVAGLLGDITDLCRARGMLNDDFVGIRLRQLRDAALEFDREVRGNPSDFAAHACTLEVKDPVVSGGVVVMTIHKAKGLEFDAVILPDLQGSKRAFTHLETGELMPYLEPPAGESSPSDRADAKSTAEGWVFPMPPENLCRLDPVLARFRQHAENNKVYEELCLLYVAMTRARQGLYLVTEEPSKKGDSLYAATVLQKTLAVGEGQPLDGEPAGRLVFAEGDPDWFAKTPQKEAAVEGPVRLSKFEPDAQAGVFVGRRLVLTLPSAEEIPEPREASILVGAGGREAACRGRALHELFQQIEWFEEGLGERILRQWRPAGPGLPAKWHQEVREEFLKALESPEIRAALSRPPGQAECWSEQAFELMEGDKWITGRMDRVVVEKDVAGRPVRATVMDYKSDRVGADQDLAECAEKYRAQVAWYVKALSRLLDLPVGRIRALLLFTHSGRTVTLSD